MNPKVSIIIPCKTLNHLGRECIEHCLKQDYSDFEILVLPDEQDEQADNLDNVLVIPTGPVGPSEKRDRALNADGDIIAFIDDDAYPAPGWLAEAVKHFSDDAVGAVGGPAVTPDSDTLAAKASGAVFCSFLGSGSLKFRYTPQVGREVDDFPSCNLLIRKSVFQQLGGFGTRYWPGEDTKLCMEMTHGLKKKIIYDPKVLVYHHRRRLFRPHLKQVWNYAVHRGYFVKKFPATSLRLSYFLPSLLVVGLAGGIVASFFSSPMRTVFLLGLGTYLAGVLASSISSGLRMVGLVFLGIISTHVTYGTGFIKGILTRSLVN